MTEQRSFLSFTPASNFAPAVQWVIQSFQFSELCAIRTILSETPVSANKEEKLKNQEDSVTNRLLLYIGVLSLCLYGCLPQQSVEVLETNVQKPLQQEASPMVAELQLSSAKTVFRVNEPIPLQMTVRIGQFNLLVPSASVEGNGAFSGLIVKNATYKTVNPQLPITLANNNKTLMRDGKAVNCIQGTYLEAGTSPFATLEDLRTHYTLVSGNYTLQVFMNLNVYREVLEDQSAQIVEMQKNIVAIQASRHSDEAKQAAIARLREDIAQIQREQQETLTQIYLPLDSRRGKTNLESNILGLTVE